MSKWFMTTSGMTSSTTSTLKMKSGNYLFTSESVSEGHPDKIADQISDGILDAYLSVDPNAKVACETLVTTGQVIIAGEIRSQAHVDVQKVARDIIREIGYTKSEYKFDADSCGILNALHEQSDDIHIGVERESAELQGAGDQGMMFGYACNETEEYMPLPLYLSHRLLMSLAKIRKEGKVMTYLRPDAKSQVTVEYSSDGKPVRIHTIVISTQHDEFRVAGGAFQDIADNVMNEAIRRDIKKYLIDELVKELPANLRDLFDENLILLVNPTGKFVIGGPHGDTGLTGRKIIVDTYGGRGAHGGGAFSGKDPSKVDRSAAYAARHIAKDMVAAGIADEILIQLSYAIGIAQPVSVFVNTYGTAKVNLSDSEIAERIKDNFDLTPYGIISSLTLRTPIYRRTAAYGHFGRKSEIFQDGTRYYTAFPWEKLDLVERIKEIFNT